MQDARWNVGGVPRLAGMTAIAIGAVVIGAWLVGVDLLKRGLPGLPQMKINTAIALIALGTGVLALREAESRARARAGRALGLVVALFGALVLVEYLIGPLGIDEALVDDPGPTPGRPAPHTAVAFIFAGSALATLDREVRGRQPSGWLLAVAGVVVLSVFVGYVYDVDFLRSTSGTTGIAINTVLALAAVVAGTACLRPDRGLVGYLRRDDVGASLARHLVPAVVLLPLALGLARQESERLGLDEAVGVGLHALATIGLFLALVLVTSRRISTIDLGRRRAEAAAMDALTHHRSLLEATPDPMIVVDEHGTITTVNHQAAETFGYPIGALVGEPVEVLLPERFRAKHVGARASFTADPHARPMGGGIELFARRSDGSELPVEISLRPLRTADGTFVIAAIRDVTERAEAGQALRASEERFRRAFDEAPIGKALADPSGRLVRVNQALCEIVGHPAGQLEGMTLEAITHADDLGEQERHLELVKSGELETHKADVRLVRANGRTVWVAMQATLLRDESGAPEHFHLFVQDITERRLSEERLRHLADHDPLTGLLNRRSFERELEAHAERAARYGAEGAVIVLDLDHFKLVNDTLGHAAGDDVIARVANALRAELRATDVLARLGGDELAILLPKADAAAARLVAGKLLSAVRRETVEIGGRERPLAASIGVALFDEGSGLTGEDVLVNADLAMYDAKHAGRGRVAVHSADERERSRMRGRIRWAQRIGAALAQDGFALHAQPIVDLTTGRAGQYELLLRMKDEHGDLVPPSAFLYIAERLGQIQEIDRWVTEQAIGLLAEHRSAGHDLTLEVNLSGLSIGDPELLELVRRELARTGIPPSSLIFEVTETAAIGHMARAGQFARDLTRLGCRFALDDFGAGYGSFHYLKHLPFDYLKIDGSFVRDCLTNETDRLLIKAVVEIANGMGKRTIAEFVEDDETARLVTRLGVDYGQGFDFGRPAPLEEALVALAGEPDPAGGRP